ncbi:MAG: shikimate kinase [Candidatus Harrisonbacteria bacterium CG10_big_fil_rev_8_21_14_0_10_49_15]|uniref:Shikimate kinase n=1 Tax=Candidatus Harrisonbacteria bacterium CG10_big_fil_rev_8_21_14_0_10_49_15 TaxID=1974587 RepID=A0A2H0UKV1_9BACT|nr:MAG: shikimate kinase [Candidatus Harrisonbacteria bacterium CG10_big_fil_rev_8_21_14_0_10_49_15]
MKLVVLFGPPAVGKMTVAQELAKITDIKVFHNHMTIDLLTKFFEFGSEPFRKLSRTFRRGVIEEAAKSKVSIAFSVAWDFSQSSDTEEMRHIKGLVESNGGSVYFVELEAPLEVRLERNTTPNRLMHKDKANVAATEKNIREWHKVYQLNSALGEFPFPEHYLRLSTEHMSAAEAAVEIKKRFGF